MLFDNNGSNSVVLYMTCPIIEIGLFIGVEESVHEGANCRANKLII